MSTRKGKKGIRNVPLFYTQIKRTRGVSLTDTAWESLNELAKTQGISASEVIERWIRSEIVQNSDTPELD